MITPEVANEYGESSAIALAMETDDALLIVDDKEARLFASNLRLKITGTLGILIRASKKGIITNLSEAISNLRKQDFIFLRILMIY